MAAKDDETVFISIFSLMSNSDNERNQDEVTLFDLKNDLGTLSIKRLIKHVVVLIDPVDELTSDNMMLNEKLTLCEDENATLNSKMSEMSFRISFLHIKSLQPNKEPRTSKVGKQKLNNLRLN